MFRIRTVVRWMLGTQVRLPSNEFVGVTGILCVTSGNPKQSKTFATADHLHGSKSSHYEPSECQQTQKRGACGNSARLRIHRSGMVGAIALLPGNNAISVACMVAALVELLWMRYSAHPYCSASGKIGGIRPFLCLCA